MQVHQPIILALTASLATAAVMRRDPEFKEFRDVQDLQGKAPGIEAREPGCTKFTCP